MKQDNSTFFIEASDYHYGNKGNWKVYKMSNGHLTQLPEPRQEDLNTYYPKTYYAFQQNETQNNGLNLKRPKGMLWGHYLAIRRGYPLSIRGIPLIASLTSLFLKSKTWLSAYYVVDGTFIDFGSGSGDYLHIMKSVSWKNVIGIEISSDACEVGRQNGLKMINGGVKELGELKNEVDVIRSSHSLEHILEIEEFFINAYNALKPGGQLLIDTPNAASKGLKMTTNYWYYLGMPVHIHIFSPDSIRYYMEKAGFEKIRVSSYSRFHSFRFSYLAKKKKIVSGQIDSYLNNTPAERFWAGIMCFIPFLISLVGTNGDCLIASAQKKSNEYTRNRRSRVYWLVCM